MRIVCRMARKKLKKRTRRQHKKWNIETVAPPTPAYAPLVVGDVVYLKGHPANRMTITAGVDNSLFMPGTVSVRWFNKTGDMRMDMLPPEVLVRLEESPDLVATYG